MIIITLNKTKTILELPFCHVEKVAWKSKSVKFYFRALLFLLIFSTENMQIADSRLKELGYSDKKGDVYVGLL